MNREQLLLNKVAASASEISRRALKCQQFGFDDGWDEIPNRDALNFELNDLYALVQMLNSEFGLAFESDKYASMEKQAKVNRWAEYSEEKGFLVEH